MTLDGTLGLFISSGGLGVLHGLEPGHGWPIAAAWALARPQPWRRGVMAASVIGAGHLLSSIVVVLLFFSAKSYFELGKASWIDWVAGSLLLILAAWQLRTVLRDGRHHHHDHGDAPDTGASLGTLTLFAITLGFAHEEEFQIIAICAGSEHCLALMLTYALAVILALVVLTLALIAGLTRFRHRLEHAQRSLTLLSALVLALMGIGFIVGIF